MVGQKASKDVESGGDHTVHHQLELSHCLIFRVCQQLGIDPCQVLGTSFKSIPELDQLTHHTFHQHMQSLVSRNPIVDSLTISQVKVVVHAVYSLTVLVTLEHVDKLL